MKEQDIAQQLGAMISQQEMYSANLSVDDSIPSELEDPEPVFEVNYDDELSESINSAYETVKIIVDSVIPKQYQKDVMIQNKMKLDAHQLGYLYYQQKTTNIALKRAMDILATGCTDPKMFMIIEKYQKVLADISGQITDTQNSFRKYYIDSYLDLESKFRADEINEPNNKRIASKGQKLISVEPTISPDSDADDDTQQFEESDDKSFGAFVTDDGGVRFSGTKDAIKCLSELKKERFKKKSQQVETADFSVVSDK